MSGEATAKCKEKLTIGLKEGIESLGFSINYEEFFAKDDIDAPLSYELEKKLRKIPAKDTRQIIENAEFHSRLTDLEGTNKEQKIASILWFGEQGEQEHIAVLEEFEKDEGDSEIKSAYKKATLRLNERINSNKPIDKNGILLDDSDVYVSPVRSSIKVEMKARMRGRVKPLTVDEEDILLDDSDVYISPVRSSIKVKMKARMREE